MAIIPEHSLLSQLSGKLGNVVIKRYKNRTVITLLPAKKKKSRLKPTELKKLNEDNFAAAVKYAQGILSDLKLKKAYEKKVAPGQTVYNYAISEYARTKGIHAGKKKRVNKK
jgi:hypothetical protein